MQRLCASLGLAALLFAGAAPARAQTLTTPTTTNKPINLVQSVSNIINGTSTIDGVIAQVGTSYFTVMRANNSFTLIFLQPGAVLPQQLFPGGHIVAIVAPSANGTNNYVLTKISAYDGIDPTVPGATAVTPPLPNTATGVTLPAVTVPVGATPATVTVPPVTVPLPVPISN